MKEFSPDQINGTREHFIREGFPIEETNLGDLPVSYFIIPEKLEPNLPDFAFRMTRTDPETQEISGIFGVSDSVPKELRPYWAAHEIIEFTQFGIHRQERCVLAEERTLRLVPKELLGQFIKRRINFFENLGSYFKRDLASANPNYTPDDLQETETSLQFDRDIRDLLAGLHLLSGMA